MVHLPKTIDNDYRGIDFTFGYFTAVEVLASEIRNLLADAKPNRGVFPGRNDGPQRRLAGLWGGHRRRGEPGDQRRRHHRKVPRPAKQVTDPKTGETTHTPRDELDEVVKRIVATMRVREEAEGKEFGVMVIAEGLAEYLPSTHIEGVPRDEHGHIAVSKLNLSRLFADLVGDRIHEADRQEAEDHRHAARLRSRCARPQAFDVMLGSQLGVGLSGVGRSGGWTA